MQIAYSTQETTPKIIYRNASIPGWMGRLGNGFRLYANATKYISLPHGSDINFGIQDNFSFSCIARISLDAVTVFFSKGLANDTDVRLVFGYASAGQFYLRFDTLAGTTMRYNMYLTDPIDTSLILNRLITVDAVKYNSSPGTSVSPSEWKIYLNGVQLAGSGYNLVPFGPADDVTNTSPMTTNITALGFANAWYCFDQKIYNRNLSGAELADKFIKENRWRTADNAEIVDYRYLSKNGLTIYDYTGNGRNASVVGYSNAETASGGSPQAGNTAWVHAYTLSPITS